MVERAYRYIDKLNVKTVDLEGIARGWSSCNVLLLRIYSHTSKANAKTNIFSHVLRLCVDAQVTMISVKLTYWWKLSRFIDETFKYCSQVSVERTAPVDT